MNSPDYKVFDIQLNLKEEGMSEMDDEESSRSIVQNRKRTTNLNVSGNIFNPINAKDSK